MFVLLFQSFDTYAYMNDLNIVCPNFSDYYTYIWKIIVRKILF